VALCWIFLAARRSRREAVSFLAGVCETGGRLAADPADRVVQFLVPVLACRCSLIDSLPRATGRGIRASPHWRPRLRAVVGDPPLFIVIARASSNNLNALASTSSASRSLKLWAAARIRRLCRGRASGSRASGTSAALNRRRASRGRRNQRGSGATRGASFYGDRDAARRTRCSIDAGNYAVPRGQSIDGDVCRSSARVGTSRPLLRGEATRYYDWYYSLATRWFPGGEQARRRGHAASERAASLDSTRARGSRRDYVAYFPWSIEATGCTWPGALEPGPDARRLNCCSRHWSQSRGLCAAVIRRDRAFLKRHDPGARIGPHAAR
jgi:hypothetical protein